MLKKIETVEIPVETVDNFEQMLSYSISTLKFWHIISEASKDIKVSVSHINDK